MSTNSIHVPFWIWKPLHLLSLYLSTQQRQVALDLEQQLALERQRQLALDLEKQLSVIAQPDEAEEEPEPIIEHDSGESRGDSSPTPSMQEEHESSDSDETEVSSYFCWAKCECGINKCMS